MPGFFLYGQMGERMSLFFSYSKTASFVHETQMFDYKRE